MEHKRGFLTGRRGNSAGKFAGALVSIVLGLALYQPIVEYVGNTTAEGTNQSLLNLIPTFWIIACLAVAVGMAVSAFRRS